MAKVKALNNRNSWSNILKTVNDKPQAYNIIYWLQ